MDPGHMSYLKWCPLLKYCSCLRWKINRQPTKNAAIVLTSKPMTSNNIYILTEAVGKRHKLYKYIYIYRIDRIRKPSYFSIYRAYTYYVVHYNYVKTTVREQLICETVRDGSNTGRQLKYLRGDRETVAMVVSFSVLHLPTRARFDFFFFNVFR